MLSPRRGVTIPLMPLTASADPAREIPADAEARRDQIAAALRSLEAEERRLVRIGLELPMARCREQRRFWSFLSGLYSMSEPLAPAPRACSFLSGDRIR